jgi:hypothetical protein
MDWSVALRVAGIPFLISRLLILLLWAGSVGITPVVSNPPPAAQDVHVVIDAMKTADRLRTMAIANDAGWYYGIAEEGYEQRSFDASRPANWAFFPLHPLLWSIVLRATGDDVLSGLVLANLTFLAALCVVYQLVREKYCDEEAAKRAMWFLCFCPTTYFFSLPWSESLFLLLTAATWLAFERRAWISMAILGIAATASRFAAIFLVLAIAVELWRRRELLSWRSIAACMSMPAGLAAFMVLLWAKTANAFAFVDVQSAWGRALTLPIKAFGVVLIKPYFLASDWNLRPLNFIAFCAAAATSVWLLRRQQWGLALFTGLSVLAPAMTGSLTSMARYTFALFPVAMVYGLWSSKGSRERTTLVMMTLVLAVLAIAFERNLAFAGA